MLKITIKFNEEKIDTDKPIVEQIIKLLKEREFSEIKIHFRRWESNPTTSISYNFSIGE